MKVVYSPRVEFELLECFLEGSHKFGSRVAKKTLGKVERSVKTTLGRQPYLGQRLVSRDA
jgi:plasmid stabilization system protein ParE